MIEIYTDGACRKNDSTAPASWAMCVYIDKEYKGKKSGIINPGTNNQAELEGVLQALEWAVKFGSDKGITVYSDSSYVVSGATTWLAGWKSRGWKLANGDPVKNIEYWKRMEALFLQVPPTLRIIKVKGHSGLAGNDKADAVCNETLDEYEKSLA